MGGQFQSNSTYLFSTAATVTRRYGSAAGFTCVYLCSTIRVKEWNQLEALLLDTAKSVLGQTTGKGAYNEKEAWWWNEKVQKAVKEKRLKFKQYQQSRCDEDKDDFREANKRAKREVAKAKESAYKDLYDKLDSIDGQKMIYKLSKTRERRTRDLTDIAYIKDSNGTILTDEDEIKARWKESFETLLNVENEREELEPTDPVQGPIPMVNDAEIEKQLSKMGRNKACGPDDLPIEAIMVIAELKPELLTYILQQIMANDQTSDDVRFRMLGRKEER